jgi:hypothetical protein
LPFFFLQLGLKLEKGSGGWGGLAVHGCHDGLQLLFDEEVVLIEAVDFLLYFRFHLLEGTMLFLETAVGDIGDGAYPTQLLNFLLLCAFEQKKVVHNIVLSVVYPVLGEFDFPHFLLFESQELAFGCFLLLAQLVLVLYDVLLGVLALVLLELSLQLFGQREGDVIV